MKEDSAGGGRPEEEAEAEPEAKELESVMEAGADGPVLDSDQTSSLIGPRKEEALGAGGGGGGSDDEEEEGVEEGGELDWVVEEMAGIPTWGLYGSGSRSAGVSQAGGWA